MPSTAEGRARRETGVIVILRRVGPFSYVAILFSSARPISSRGKIGLIDLRSGYCCPLTAFFMGKHHVEGHVQRLSKSWS